MMNVAHQFCKYDIFKKTDFARRPISDDDVNLGLDQLIRKKAQQCEIKDDIGMRLMDVTYGPLRDGSCYD